MEKKSLERGEMPTWKSWWLGWKSWWLGCFFCVAIICLCGCGCTGGINPPLTVTFRESLMNSSLRVMLLTNRSGEETIVATVAVRDRLDDNKMLKCTLKIEPGETKEVGFLQTGYNLDKGDKYKVYCDGYLIVLTGDVP